MGRRKKRKHELPARGTPWLLRPWKVGDVALPVWVRLVGFGLTGVGLYLMWQAWVYPDDAPVGLTAAFAVAAVGMLLLGGSASVSNG